MPYKDLKIRRDYGRNYNRVHRAQNRAEYFKDKKCVRCGSKQNLEVDHINPRKKSSDHFWLWSKERRDVELKKCQVLCLKCHKKKHCSPHGSRGRYEKHGCHCMKCKQANTQRMRRYRLKRRGVSATETQS